MSRDYYTYLLEAVRSNVLPITSRCNTGCVFCSHLQNPPGIVTYRIPALPLAKIQELAQFLNPHEKVVIGESATRLDEGEPFTHPDIIAILAMLRRMLPKTTLAVTTNGTLLTKELVAQLAELQPLELTVSLNSATEAGRLLLMKDRQPERALLAIALLQKYKLPFHGSLVAIPRMVGWDDIKETVSFLAARGVLTIRIFMPGYTQYAPREFHLDALEWHELISWAKEQTKLIGIPIIPEPLVPDRLEASIWGVVPDSPAQRAGIQQDDIILEINGKPVTTRVEAFHMARRLPSPQITLLHSGDMRRITVDKAAYSSPGFVVLYDFAKERAAAIAAEITRSCSTAALLLASEFGASVLRQVISHLQLTPVTVQPVPNHFFGGSIKAAGLLTVSDFLTAARQAFQDKMYDLLLLPQEAFDHRDCDLLGQKADILSQELHVPVAIL